MAMTLTDFTFVGPCGHGNRAKTSEDFTEREIMK